MTEIHLSDYIDQEAINLAMRARSKDGALKEMVELLAIDPESKKIALELVHSREALGSTGIGKGVAIPHLRSTVFRRIMISYGRSKKGIDFASVDGEPAHHFFLVASPPVDPSNLYHPILAKIVQLVKTPANKRKFDDSDSRAEILNLMDELTG